jgi:hypothetical protein
MWCTVPAGYLGGERNVKYKDLKRGLLLVFEFNTAVNLKVRFM